MNLKVNVGAKNNIFAKMEKVGSDIPSSKEQKHPSSASNILCIEHVV